MLENIILLILNIEFLFIYIICAFGLFMLIQGFIYCFTDFNIYNWLNEKFFG